MPFTAHYGAAYNVEGSFNNFFRRNLTGAGLPTWMSSAVINYDYPRKPLTFPSFSVTHIGATPFAIAEGNVLDAGYRGVRQVGLAEIDAWESITRDPTGYQRNIRQMRDMVARIFATGAAIDILDVYGTTASPTAIGALIRARPAETIEAPPDPNPDIVRIRMLITYNWLERVSG